MFELPAGGSLDRRSNGTSERRRLVTQQVRAARQNLTSAPGATGKFNAELARVYAQNRLAAVPVILMLAVVIAGGSLYWIPAELSVAWLVTALLGHALVVFSVRNFAIEAQDSKSLSRWTRRFVVAEALNGLAWSSLVVTIELSGAMGSAAEIVSLFLMLVGVAVATMLAATVPVAMAAATLSISTVVVATYAIKGGVTANAIAAMTIGAEVYFLLLAQRLHRTTRETLEYRAEKDALIGELEQAKANSDEARRRAEEANLAKSRFLATMSHELRTPLNAILGFSEVMKAEILGAHAVPTYKEYADDIHQSGQHLLDLINEILDLSRIEAGRYELNEESIRLAFIVEDCHHLLKLRAKNRGIAIRVSSETGLPPVWADERAMRQVVLNLLSNAIKFTPQGGEILLKLGWTASGGQYVSVSDNGPGIPDDEIPMVLASFGQGTLAIKAAEQGAGLGLPIVKGLIDLHGGSFSLKSKLRQGTEVVVTLPASRVMNALAPERQAGTPARDRAETPGGALQRTA